jgi:hypothetical protein
VKIKTGQIVEMVLGLMFICGYFLFHAASVARWVTSISAMILGTMYFPLGFLTLKSEKYNVGFSIFFGMLFSAAVVTILFGLMQYALSAIFLLGLPVIFLMLAITQALVFYFITKRNEYQILFYDRWLTARYLVLFVLMLYSLFTYDFRT